MHELVSRTRTRQVLAELNRQLTAAIAALEAESPAGRARELVGRLADTREAVSLLVLERAAADGRPERNAAPAIERRLELESVPASARKGRAFVRQVLQDWGLEELVVNAAADVTSELIANAVRETQSHVVLSMRLEQEHLVVSVWDDGDGRPQLRPYRPGISERGIGLRLVKHLSHEWGWHAEQAGKWVWARLAVSRARSQEP